MANIALQDVLNMYKTNTTTTMESIIAKAKLQFTQLLQSQLFVVFRALLEHGTKLKSSNEYYSGWDVLKTVATASHTNIGVHLTLEFSTMNDKGVSYNTKLLHIATLLLKQQRLSELYQAITHTPVLNKCYDKYSLHHDMQTQVTIARYLTMCDDTCHELM